jgi:hypothetical protein
VPDRWRQDGGFSVFFDVQSPGPDRPGELLRRTRLYHEETGGETTFPGWRPTAWVNWILDRLGSQRSPSPSPSSEPTGAACSLVSMEIIDARLIGDPAPVAEGDTEDDAVAVELRLRINGMADLNRTLAARVVGVLFGCDPP